MTMPQNSRLAQDLYELLMSERTALLEGDLASATALSQEKLRLLDGLERTLTETPGIVPRTLLENIRNCARENAQHMSAIRHGLRSALVRLDRLSHDTSVGAYNPAGTQVPFKSAAGSYLRKV